MGGHVGQGVTDIGDLRARLLGRELAVGTYRVPHHEAWLTADCLGSPPLPPDSLHPMFVFYASLVGVGYTIEELWDLAEVSAEVGPMIGEMDLEQDRPLRVGETLTVRSTITDLVRKRGSSGTFDALTVDVSLTDEAGQPAGRVRNTHIYPRRP